MSRIIVKNLPKKIKEERLREFFSSKGTVTDVQLKFTREGVFRRFAFVGFKDEAQAVAAKEYFNNSYLGTSKLQVEMSAPLGDAEKPRSWSKYSQDSSAYRRLHPQHQLPTAVEKEEEEAPKADFANAFLKDLEGDEQFAEFLAVHGSQRAAWGNDTRPPPPTSPQKPADAAGSGDEEEPSGGSERLPTAGGGAQGQRAKPKQPLPVQEFEFTLKVSGLPYKCKKKQIRDFFKPAQVLSLRLPPRVKGIAYLGFRREKDMKQALHKHHSFMAGRRIDVTRYTKRPPPEEEEQGKGRSKKWRQFEDLGNPQETLADTGRLFIRNLSYTVTEEELEALFRKYGPLEEVHLSIDRVTRKPKGFAFVSFLFPEHAIRAFSELDGHMLQGRLLHLLPGKAKESAAAGKEEQEQGGPQTFKDKKEAALKKASGKCVPCLLLLKAKCMRGALG